MGGIHVQAGYAISSQQEYAYPEAELQERRRLDVVGLQVFRVYY
jgi:hypothetical protein